MKYIELSIAFLLLFFVSSCEEEDYSAPDLVTDVAWYTSIQPGETHNIDQGSFVSIMDISQGTIDHSWTIQDGNHFLLSGFSKNDSLPLFIDPDAGLTTTDPTVHILFQKQGLNTVRLRNTFPEFVDYKGSLPIDAVKEDGVWVIDTTMVFDVFGELKPAFKVLKEGVEVLNVTGDELFDSEDKTTWDTIKVEAGQSLQFVDMTTEDRPTDREWIIKNGTMASSSDSVATVAFYSLGISTGTLNSIRGDEYPEASVKKVIPIIISVIPSSQPFEFVGDLGRIASNKVSFKVSGEIGTIGDELANFTVHATNADSDFEGDIDVLSVVANSSDKTTIELTLADNIYSSDQITVEYAPVGESTIVTSDFRTLQAFGKQSVVFGEGANAFDSDIFGFELDGKEWFFQHPNQWSNNTEQTSTGSHSLKFSSDVTSAASKMKVQSSVAKNPISITQGEYTISLSVWIDPASDIKCFDTNIDNPWKPINWSLVGVDKGKWVTLSQDISYSTDTNIAKTKFVFQVAKAYMLSDNVTFYIDDVKMIRKEVRPM